MKKHVTEQETFWAGEFGSEYIRRNRSEVLLASNISLFSKALRSVRSPSSAIEIGANIGMNLSALKILYPDIELHGVEINEDAAKALQENVPEANVNHVSIMDFEPARQWDLVLSKGVLIHIAPESLKSVYEKLIAACSRYLLVAEYYNPSPVAVPYRGHTNRLFKRDFAGEMMDMCPELQLRDYGFVYHRDTSFPQDDITWFLMEKVGESAHR